MAPCQQHWPSVHVGLPGHTVNDSPDPLSASICSAHPFAYHSLALQATSSITICTTEVSAQVIPFQANRGRVYLPICHGRRDTSQRLAFQVSLERLERPRRLEVRSSDCPDYQLETYRSVSSVAICQGTPTDVTCEHSLTDGAITASEYSW